MSDTYDPTKRQQEPSDDDCFLERIEVEFAIPVYITASQQHRLCDLIDEICRDPNNTPINGVHWQSGLGSKPNWSQADSEFLGKPCDPNAPAAGEPTFDDSVYFVETSARESSPEEQAQSAKLSKRYPKPDDGPGVQFIAHERARQKIEEGWTLEHDDVHGKGELAGAAAVYALHACGFVDAPKIQANRPDVTHPVNLWPFGESWWKPSDPIRDLVKSGALIAAEIDRRLRLEKAKQDASE